MASETKNLLELKQHLESGENIKHTVFGAYESKILGSDTARNGILVATDKRLIFYAKKMFGFDMEVFPYSNISSIELNKELMGHKITLFATGNKIKVKWIHSNTVSMFVDFVRSNIGKQSEAITQITQVNQKSAVEQIKELKELLDMGIISQQEFDVKKQKLLDTI